MNFEEKKAKTYKTRRKRIKKYVGVQSWKAMHLPTLDIRVEQKGNRAMKWKIHISFKTGLVPVSPC